MAITANAAKKIVSLRFTGQSSPTTKQEINKLRKTKQQTLVLMEMEIRTTHSFKIFALRQEISWKKRVVKD